jgi:hypothetical protein
MSDQTPTFAFEDDKVYALVNGQVVASGDSLEEAEEALEIKRAEESEVEQEERKKKNATHIVTPNGLKGAILNREWGDQVTARFDNGSISTFKVTAGAKWVNEDNTKTAGASPIDTLESRVSSTDFAHDREGLVARREELQSIRHEARSILIKGASYLDEHKLDNIVVTAEAELAEVGEAIEHLDSEHADSFAPPAPFRTEVVEQAALGGGDSTWLDHAVQEMTDEAAALDFQKELAEGPGLFVTELDDGVVADTGATREVALAHIQSKTASVDSDQLERYTTLYLARVEEARRKELASRKETTKKEAAHQKEALDNVPDEALFS